MAQITPNLQLTVWNNLNDPYDSGQLADNFVKIDLHNHDGAGGGIQLNGSTAIAPDSISSVQIGANAVGSTELLSDAGNDANRAVGSNHIKDSAVVSSKIADQAITPSKLESSFRAAISPLYIDATVGGHTSLNNAINAAYPGYQVVNGTEIYYKAAANVVWHFRYNSSASTYKWEFMGGPAMLSFDDTNDVAATDEWAASDVVKITLPDALTGGIFDISYYAQAKLINSSSGDAKAGALIAYRWAASDDSDIVSLSSADNNAAVATDMLASNTRSPKSSISRTMRVTKSANLSASTIRFAQRHQVQANSDAAFSNRTLSVTPVAII